MTNGQMIYTYVVCPCLRVIHQNMYESVQVYNRSQVSVYTTIGPLVIFSGQFAD